MITRIYTMTHKKFDVPKDPMYVPLQVGRAVHEDLGYVSDDTGISISEKNCYYSELTGIYWIWKNVKDVDYVGVCHYRRYLINEKGAVFTRAEIEQLLSKVDIITTKRVKLRMPYYDGYKATHHIENLDATGEVIKELYPEYYDNFTKLVHSDETYFGNIMITDKKTFDAYAKWLFTIFAEVEKRVDIDSYDAYHKRVFGFISEILLLVWMRTNKKNVYECQVGMIGEKVETREIKDKMAEYFKKKDISGAKAYLLDAIKKRPDVLMEASDITGELKLSMQVIATCEAEIMQTGNCVLDKVNDFQQLMNAFRRLNKVVEHFRKKEETNEDILYIKEHEYSKEALDISLKVLCFQQDELVDTTKKIQECI